MVRGWERADFP